MTSLSVAVSFLVNYSLWIWADKWLLSVLIYLVWVNWCIWSIYFRPIMQFVIDSSIPVEIVLGCWIDEALSVIHRTHCYWLTIRIVAVEAVTIDMVAWNMIAWYIRVLALFVDEFSYVIVLIVECLLSITW